jgi:Fe-S-cluster containining protein
VTNEELYDQVANALRKMRERADAAERELAELRAVNAQLVEILVGKGVLASGHERVLERAGERAEAAVPVRHKLRIYKDKYLQENSEIDCAARMHLCHARCCTFSFELSPQDLAEGKVRWELDDPFVIKHEADGHCTHLRGDGGCGVYEHRPTPCRAFDCRYDDRIWIDFDARIPHPWPDDILTRR